MLTLDIDAFLKHEDVLTDDLLICHNEMLLDHWVDHWG